MPPALGSGIPFRKVEGRFVRAVLADRAGDVVAPPGPLSAGRYHRPGQAALYMSATVDGAIAAVSKYMRADRLPRIIVPLLVGEALVIDQREADACRGIGIDPTLSSFPWQPALAAGQDPPSWRNADAARAAGADGIIDCSRTMPGAWHLNLFRWNGLGGPSVTVCGEAV
ncbi:MAG TPA: RES domain-containing protein, partial [Rhodopila sp.]|nr:RES domain-containing protein [Rhodopila sp.]